MGDNLTTLNMTAKPSKLTQAQRPPTTSKARTNFLDQLRVNMATLSILNGHKYKLMKLVDTHDGGNN